MKIIEVISALEQFAPLPLQESYDNAGLQVGLTEAEVSGALLCLDVTEETVDEAIALGCNLIVSHHPLIFHRLSSVSGASYVERCVMKAIKNDIVIASMHTNMDNAVGGVNYKIAEKIGLTDIHIIGGEKTAEGVTGGSAVMGTMPQPLTSEEFIAMVKERFNVKCAQCNQLLRRPVSKVAICGGAGSFMTAEAVKAGADAFITGEAHYHEFFGYEQKIQIAVIGHYESEQYTNEIFKTIIEEKCSGVRCHLTAVNTNPIIYL